ncbi:MAG: nuclear transport factor 2 family protein [Myxococcales bacterium]|nr:nuclear transport factor 2 family protein [Myxococcales bacterium]
MTSEDVVRQYFICMQRGAEAETDLLALFHDDAVYVEPFTAPGTSRTHEGKPAIRAALRQGWEAPPPDMTLTVDRIDTDGDEVTSRWTCASPVFPGPIAGEDRYVVREGRIARLDVRLL